MLAAILKRERQHRDSQLVTLVASASHRQAPLPTSESVLCTAQDAIDHQAMPTAAAAGADAL